LRKSLFLILCVVVLFSGCKEDTPVIPTEFMRINSAEISAEEYQIYLDETKHNFEEIGGIDIWETDFDGRNAFEVARESALNSMIVVKVSAQKAKEIGVTLSGEDKKEIELEIERLLSTYENVSKKTEDAMAIIMRDRKLHSLIRQETVKGVSISESEYFAYNANYFEETSKQMQEIVIQFIVCDNEVFAEAVYEKAVEGESFDSLIVMYSISKDNNFLEMLQKDVEDTFGRELEVEAGFVSDPIEFEDGTWRIFKVRDIIQSSEERVVEKLREDYKNAIWQQIFSNEVEKWINEAVIERNEEAWQKVLSKN